ncbi:MAG TPA: hypothetical protein DCE20_03405 [Gammaproteobacteria bacterium]|nr:hypothetical protein [Gammaproteobacteria bacterium]
MLRSPTQKIGLVQTINNCHKANPNRLKNDLALLTEAAQFTAEWFQTKRFKIPFLKAPLGWVAPGRLGPLTLC